MQLQTAQFPYELFRSLDATSLDDDTEFNFDFSDLPGEGTTHTVEFEEVTHDEREERALELIRDAAVFVDTLDNVDLDAKAQYVHRDDDEEILFLADSDRLGYEVTRSDSPKRIGFVVLDEDAIVAIRLDDGT